MCSIAGHIGKKEGLETVLESLKRMEYRGYDSAGVLFFQNNKPVLIKRQGKLVNLEAVLRETADNIGLVNCRNLIFNIGIGTTCLNQAGFKFLSQSHLRPELHSLGRQA